MTLLKLKGDKVIGVYENISPNYQPKLNEVLIESLPEVQLNADEVAHIYYKYGKIEYVKENKNTWLLR